MTTIVDLAAAPWNIELTEPFGIAGGSQELAANVLVTLRLSDGTRSYGEAAPFPAVNGETQGAALSAIESVKAILVGRSLHDWRQIAAELNEALGPIKSALAALETALLDAHCRERGLSLWRWAGGRERSLITDITIPTGSVDKARQAATSAVISGFEELKIKVGGVPLDLDRQRIVAVLAAAPKASVLLDGNAAFTSREATALITSLGDDKQRIVIFEQPTAKGDFDALSEVRSKTGLKIAADESAQTRDDVTELARLGAADIINVKIMKSGVLESLAMIESAKAHGLGVMMGGMVESDLAMGTSAALAAGLGGFAWLDLDTPLFMKRAPTEGGVKREGARIDVDGANLGHGVTPLTGNDAPHQPQRE